VTRALRPALLGAFVFCATFISSSQGGDADLRADLAGYRQWTQLLKVPYQVPLELWMRCVAATPPDWKAARENYGPHTERFIRVYGNPTALASLPASAKAPFRLGTVIAKEKLSKTPHGPADGVAFMVKRETSAFPESGGWEFLYYPSSGDGRTTHQACASCHRRARSRDYVFGDYPR
jgi:hypothetical protein